MLVRKSVAALAVACLSVVGVSTALALPALAEDAPAVEQVIEPAPAPEPEIIEAPAVVEEAPAEVQSLGKPEAKPKPPKHDPVTFCHKPGEKNQQTLTTDDDGFLQGHLGHGDTLGECVPLSEPEPQPEPFKAYETSARWLLPASWPSNVTPTYQAAIFPQDRLTIPLPCGRWSQDDVYWIDSPEDETLYNSLGDVLTQGEDGAIYKSHVFTYGGDCREVPQEPEPRVETRTWLDGVCIEDKPGYVLVTFYGQDTTWPVTFDEESWTWVEGEPVVGETYVIKEKVLKSKGCQVTPTPTPTPTDTPTETPTSTPTDTPTTTPSPSVTPTVVPVVSEVHTVATLATTGNDLALPIGIGASLLLLAGLALVTAARRRKVTEK